MKKLFALLLVVCMIAGLVACGRKTENPEKDPTNATVDTEATEVLEGTEISKSTEETPSTEVTKALEQTDAYVETESPEESEATRNDLSGLPTTKPTEIITSPTAETVATTATKVTAATEVTKPDPAASPFNGKTIEIYGLGSDTSYTNYSQYDEKYAWMMRAAVVEWAEMNGVTLVFSGDYDQNKILSAMRTGDCPDVVFHTDKFPAIANVDIITYFTDAEYKKLADICGSDYLDLLNYQTKSHGFVLPWSGTTMCYYNKTLFDNYGVKTPKEYFMEGEWTWENFQKCMEEMTMDINADDKIDIYGLPGDSLTRCPMVNPFKTDASGKLVNTIDDPMIQAFFQFKYDVFTAKKCALPSKNNIQTNVDFPMFALQMSECEPYNAKQLYQSLSNGNELEVVPVPAYEGRNLLQWTQACASLASTCDERAAAVDMLSYLLKCGMKYMSDCSLGTVKCDYEGILGISALSAEFMKAFTKLCESRAEDVKKITNYDEELIAKIYESFLGAEWYTYQTYTGVTLLTSYSEITQMLPESAIPAVKPKYEADIQKYNETYINES